MGVQGLRGYRYMWVSKGKVIWHPPLQKEYKTEPHWHPFPRGEKQKQIKKQLRHATFSY